MARMYHIAVFGIVITAIAAISSMAGKIKVRGEPLGAIGVLTAASLLSAVAALIGIPMDSIRDLTISGMGATLAASLLALGLMCAGSILSRRSIPIAILAAILVLAETGIPLAAGHFLQWSKAETAAMSSNAAAAVAALATHPDLRADPAFWGSFGCRYLIQMILPLALLSWYLRSQQAVEHHSRKCRAFGRAAHGSGYRRHELDVGKAVDLSAVLAIVDVVAVERGGVVLPVADVSGGLVPGDEVVILADAAERARVAALVGHVDHARWAWPVALGAVLAGTAALHVVAHLSLPIAALLAALAVGIATTVRPPAGLGRWLRKYGLLGFLATTGGALGYQFLSLDAARLLTYTAVSIATSITCWYAAVWIGPYVLGSASPKMRSLGVLAGSTTSSGLAETISRRTGTDVAAMAFAVAYPIGSLGKVAIVAWILH